MKALYFVAPRTFELREKARFLPEGYALVRVRSAGICGSDLHGYTGASGRRLPPMIMGHEFSGEVCETGAGVAGVKVGDRVAVFPLVSCGQCAYCREGRENLCLDKTFLGSMAEDGGFCEYVAVKPENLVLLPESMSFDEGALIEPLAVCLAATNKLRAALGDILVVGGGTIGLLCMWLLKRRGGRVFLCDYHRARREAAPSLGADGVIDAADDPLAAVRALSGGRMMDATVEAVGESASARLAMDALRYGGESLWVGLGDRLIEVDMQDLVGRQKTVYGTFIYTRRDFLEATDILHKNRDLAMKIITDRISLEQTPAMFEKLAGAPGETIKAIVTL